MRLSYLAATAVLLMTSPFLRADTYSFTVSSPAVNGSGTFTTVANGSIAGAQNIATIFGTVNGSVIANLISSTYDPSSYTVVNFSDGSYYDFDNVYYKSGNAFDDGGLLFDTANGDYFNFYQDPSLGTAYLTLNGTNAYDSLATDLGSDTLMIRDLTTAAATPEPNSLMLLGTGVLTLAGVFRKRLSLG